MRSIGSVWGAGCLARAVACAGALAAGCGGESDRPLELDKRPMTPDPAAVAPALGETTQVVPGPGMPVEYASVAMPANNNLDVVRHQGRVFLAIRNSETHFASANARMYVFSSSDEKTWAFEQVFAVGADLREPRLLSYKGRLLLFFARLGVDKNRFEPSGMFVSEYLGPRQWTEPKGFYRPGESFVPWRVKVLGGRAYMTAYEDGEHEYDFTGLPVLVHFLASDDGLTWGPAGSKAVVTSGGGSESDFAFDEAGDLYAVQRNESGDDTGWGSKLCHAPRQDISAWSCVKHDPRKYDSPLMFARGSQVFIIGRRTTANDGKFELQGLAPGEKWSAAKAVHNLFNYSITPKRCSIWQLDRATLDVRWLVDLPSRGDTCFPAMIDDPSDPRRAFVYNYSSPIDGPDRTWLQGQNGETRVYRTPVTFF